MVPHFFRCLRKVACHELDQSTSWKVHLHKCASRSGSTNGSTNLGGIELVAQTDGERFVIMIEEYGFAGEIGAEKSKSYLELIRLLARIVKSAITYPLGIELFAFVIRQLWDTPQLSLAFAHIGPSFFRKSSCKNFDDDYNATPSLKAKWLSDE